MERIRPVLVIGESLVDVVVRPGSESEEFPGGSAANAAVALARLGESVHLATALGPDRHGELIRAHLGDSGVGWASEPLVLGETARAEALIGPDGSATYTFDIDWEVGPLHADLPAPLAVVVSSLAPVLEPGAARVFELVEAHAGSATVVYDINARPAITGAGERVVAAVERMASLADLVKASDEDLAVLWPHLELREAAERLLDLGASAVAITLGAEGSAWVDRERHLTEPAVLVEVVDTIGAGDTFGAALVSHLLDLADLGSGADVLGALAEDDVREALRWAARAAAVTVSRPGPNPPTRDEVAAT